MKTKLLAIFVLLVAATITGSAGLSTSSPYSAGNPFTLVAKNVTVLTAGVPADVVTIPVPFARWRMTGTVTTSASSSMVIESQAGTPAAASFTAFDAAAGGGNTMLAATSPNSGVNASAAWIATAVATVSTSSTIVIRQTVASANAATISFYVSVIPLP